MDFKKIIVVCGHYGCGKTNLAINIALDLKKQNNVLLIDMDVVNPYFRSSEYKQLLEQKGIDVIVPQFANSTLDVPSLSASIASAFSYDGYVVFDVGGDDVGAAAMGRYYAQLNAADHEIIYVVNQHRNLTESPEQAVEILREIEYRARFKADCIVNNSHMSYSTKADDVLSSNDYAKEICDITGLPLKFTAVKSDIANEVSDKISDIYPVDIIVKPVWE
ncbi:MAG: zeta toxin family protein [Clostridia bacterium]|nr:zeta toxin family protein [Clostridia bacterium]